MKHCKIKIQIWSAWSLLQGIDTFLWCLFAFDQVQVK